MRCRSLPALWCAREQPGHCSAPSSGSPGLGLHHQPGPSAVATFPVACRRTATPLPSSRSWIWRRASCSEHRRYQQQGRHIAAALGPGRGRQVELHWRGSSWTCSRRGRGGSRSVSGLTGYPAAGRSGLQGSSICRSSLPHQMYAFGQCLAPERPSAPKGPRHEWQQQWRTEAGGAHTSGSLSGGQPHCLSLKGCHDLTCLSRALTSTFLMIRANCTAESQAPIPLSAVPACMKSPAGGAPSVSCQGGALPPGQSLVLGGCTCPGGLM